jgi:tetratricopeptide (TPR) repeat protein
VTKRLLVVLGAMALLVGQAWGQAYTPKQANAYIAAHDGQGALRYATAWTKAEPNNYFAWGALGAAYGIGLQQPANAITAFQRALTIRPDAPECLNAMGIEYVNLKNYAEATKVLKRATEKAPTRANYWNDLAAVYSYQNQRNLALEALDNSQKFAGPGANYTDWYNMGNGFYKLQDYPKALFAFQQAVRLNPRYGNAWNNLGTTQQWLGNASEALRAYKQAGAMGDPLGSKNYTQLNNAILAAQQAARNTGKATSGMDRIVALHNAQFAYDHSWHDPNSMRGRPN